MAYLYRHIRFDKNEPFYIGVGNLHSDDRHKRAGKQYGRNNLWKKIVNKTDYKIDIMIDDLTYDECLQKEIEFVKLYGRINLGTGTLANLTDGGDGNVAYVPSEETKKKMSERLKGGHHTPEHIQKRIANLIGKKRPKELCEKISNTKRGKKLSAIHCQCISDCMKGEKNHFYGKTHSEEARKKISEGLKGKMAGSKNSFYGYIPSEETLKKISRQVIDINTGIVYKSIREAANSLNMNYNSLKARISCEGRNPTSIRYYDAHANS
jgi:hypothetical protein